MKARVEITLKGGVLDPQGKAIGHALHGLGFADVGEVRQGKLIELDLAETDPARARAQVEEIANTKMADLNARDLEHACRIVEGTARSAGIQVQG